MTKKKNAKNKDKVLKDLKAAIKEVNLAKQGKIKLKTLDEFLNELRIKCH